jgi:autotransporter-associated beta strand protein
LELNGRLGLLGAPATGQNRQHSFNVPLTLTGASQITVPANVELTLNRPLSSTVGLLKSGAGKLRLNDVATYDNETVIEDGILEIGTVANAIPSGSRVILGGPSSAGMLMLGTYPNPQALRLTQLETRGLKGRVVAQAEPLQGVFSTLTLDVPAGTHRNFDGELGQFGFASRNQLALIKQGGGTYTLAGQSNAVGAVDIQAGRLAISGDWSSALGPLTVARGASLAGSSVLGGAVTVRSGATWVAAPVDSSGRPATRRLLRSVTFEPSTTIRLEGPSCPPPGTYPLLETAQSLSVPTPLPAITTAFSTTGKRLALAVQSTTQPATRRLNLVVTASGRTFQQWLTDNAVPATNGGIAAAFTQHGSRYSFDSPARVTLAREPSSTDARATVNYRRRANTELQFLVETTSALANPAAWTTDLEAQETAVVPTSDGWFETVTVTLSQPWPASGAFFVRVRAQLDAPLSPAALLP